MPTALQDRYFRWIVRLLVVFLFVLTFACAIYQGWEHTESSDPDFMDEVLEVTVVFTAGVLSLPAMMYFVRRLCQKMLQPLQSIRETAERIIAGQLDERVRTENPSDDLGLLAGTINKAFDRYSEAMDRQQRFASDASHQLRTPLTSIRTTGEVCLQKMDRSTDEYRETIGSMLEDVQRLSDMVEKLLILARLGAEHIRASFKVIDLAAEIRSVALQYESLYASKNLRVKLVASSACLVHGDAALLQQMAANLFDNAIRHAPEGGIIVIDVAPDSAGNNIVFTVRDNGPGVARDVREMLFQRFARGKSNDTTGNGLGLSIVADIVNLHGGTIDLLSEPGAAFRITLPRDVVSAGTAEHAGGI